MVEFFLAVFLMLLISLFFGEILQRAKQPALVGQLLAGVLIGPSILNIVQPTSDLSTIANVALFFIMLVTGLSIKTREIIEAGKPALVVSLLAFIIPFACGFEVANLFHLSLVESLVVGLTIAITAVPVNAVILMEAGLLKTKLGTTVVTAGVINDILSLTVLGLIMSINSNHDLLSSYAILIPVAKVLLFVGGVFLVDKICRDNTTKVKARIESFSQILHTRESKFAFVLIFALGLSLVAEQAGLHFIIGTFFAGLLANGVMGDETLREATNTSSVITFAFFAPIVFAFIGLEFNAEAVAGVLVFATALLIEAIAAKMGGGIIGALLVKFPPAESITIGFLMNSRGMVELVIASVAYQSGLIPLSIYSVVVGIGVVTTTISATAPRLLAPRFKTLMNPSSKPV